MAVTTTRLLIVCAEAVRAQMNATLGAIDPSSAGDVMHAAVALPSAPGTVVGRWTSWALTDEQRGAILQAYAQQGWRPLKGSEGRVHQPGETIPAWGSQRFWLFDGVTWTSPMDVLAALQLTAWAPPGEE